MKLSAILPLLLLLLPTTLAVQIRGTILPSPILPSPSLLPPDTTITLTTSTSRHTALLRADNTFFFRSVAPGSYLLETVSSSHGFPPLRVDVDASGRVRVAGTWRGGPWGNVGEAIGGVEVRADSTRDPLVHREGFSPIKMLTSPMMLLAIFGLGSVIVLPRVMDKLDPEFKAELAAAQSKRGKVTAQDNPLANFDVAGFLAGKSSSSSSSSSPS